MLWDGMRREVHSTMTRYVSRKVGWKVHSGSFSSVGTRDIDVKIIDTVVEGKRICTYGSMYGYDVCLTSCR